jgi:uncharacterized protein (DUF58 family)
MTDWIRRPYAGVGLTQSPPGPHLAELQEFHLGKVILCIDVSSSMAAAVDGQSRLRHAIAGAERFIADAVANNYSVGLILWNHAVSRSVPLGTDPEATLAALRAAGAGGGTDVFDALNLGLRQLAPLTGDRVLAVFGDGDLGNRDRAVATARTAAEHGIRIIVRGLGEYASAQLNLIATEPDEQASAIIDSAPGIEAGIASMAQSLRIRGIAAKS